MALPRDLASGSAAAVNASRLSLASDAPSRDGTDYSAANTTRNGITVPPELLQKSAAAQARYRMLSTQPPSPWRAHVGPTMQFIPRLTQGRRARSYPCRVGRSERHLEPAPHHAGLALGEQLPPVAALVPLDYLHLGRNSAAFGHAGRKIRRAASCAGTADPGVGTAQGAQNRFRRVPLRNPRRVRPVATRGANSSSRSRRSSRSERPGDVSQRLARRSAPPARRHPANLFRLDLQPVQSSHLRPRDRAHPTHSERFAEPLQALGRFR